MVMAAVVQIPVKITVVVQVVAGKVVEIELMDSVMELKALYNKYVPDLNLFLRFNNNIDVLLINRRITK
jgi:hypothetical protein